MSYFCVAERYRGTDDELEDEKQQINNIYGDDGDAAAQQAARADDEAASNDFYEEDNGMNMMSHMHMSDMMDAYEEEENAPSNDGDNEYAETGAADYHPLNDGEDDEQSGTQPNQGAPEDDDEDEEMQTPAAQGKGGAPAKGGKGKSKGGPLKPPTDKKAVVEMLRRAGELKQPQIKKLVTQLDDEVYKAITQQTVKAGAMAGAGIFSAITGGLTYLGVTYVKLILDIQRKGCAAKVISMLPDSLVNMLIKIPVVRVILTVIYVVVLIADLAENKGKGKGKK